MELQNYTLPSIRCAFKLLCDVIVLYSRWGIWYQRKCFYRIAGAKPILGRLFNGVCGSLLRGFATMGSDEDTRRGTSPEKVNEYRREVWGSRCYSAVWMKAIGHSIGQSSELESYDFSQALSRRYIVWRRDVYIPWKKRKAALSIELLINNDWIGEILSGVMTTEIVRHVAYRDLIYGYLWPAICLRIASKLLRVKVQRTSTPE